MRGQKNERYKMETKTSIDMKVKDNIFVFILVISLIIALWRYILFG